MKLWSDGSPGGRTRGKAPDHSEPLGLRSQWPCRFCWFRFGLSPESPCQSWHFRSSTYRQLHWRNHLTSLNLGFCPYTVGGLLGHADLTREFWMRVSVCRTFTMMLAPGGHPVGFAVAVMV